MKKRVNLRLSGYDYGQPGGYFITFCTKGKAKILGEVVGGGVLDAPHAQLSPYGLAVDRCIRDMQTQYAHISIPCYVIMPNHVHMLIMVNTGKTGSSGTPTPTNQTIPALLSTIKRLTNRAAGETLWQRGYYDHIIRNYDDYLQISEYIVSNPARWQEDEYYDGKSSMPITTKES